MRETLMRELGRFVPPTVTPEQVREIEEFERAAEREAWRGRLKASGIPTRYRSARLSEFPPEVGRYAECVMAGGTRGLLLVGPYGTGKTRAACAVLSAVARRYPVLFAAMPDVVQEAATFERGALSRYGRAYLLCLDDLGKERPSEFAMEQVYGVIDRRWRDGRPTVVTTNHGQSELYDHFTRVADPHTANAVMSRLLGMCDVVEMDGPDRRTA